MDCPGQVELFTLHKSLLNIVQIMTDEWHMRWALQGSILRQAAARALQASWDVKIIHVGVQARYDQSGGCTPVHGPREVPECAAAELEQHAAPGAAAC